MSENKVVTLDDLQDTMDRMTVEWKKFRDACIKIMTPERFAALEAEDPDESANEEIDHGEEAIELMVRPDFVLDEDRLRDEENERRTT